MDLPLELRVVGGVRRRHPGRRQSGREADDLVALVRLASSTSLVAPGLEARPVDVLAARKIVITQPASKHRAR
jgi:hypothetical protein